MGASAMHRARFAALVTILGVAGAILVAPQASADVTAVTSTATTAVAAGVSTALAGVSIAVGDAESVEVNVSTTSGTLTVDTSTGVTIAYGYSATAREVAFRGTGAQANAALASLHLTAASGDRGGSATVNITARTSDGYIYSSQNQHFYEYVSSPGITWSSARAAAKTRTYRGQDGYLATVPNATVNDLITSKIPGAINVWLGGQGVLNTGGYGRVWSWVDGPLRGTPFSRCTSNGESVPCDFVASGSFYYHWATGEPNNYTGGEPYIVTNWTTANGQWNDLPNSASSISGYVVEYGDLAYGSSSMTGIYSASSTVDIKGVPGAPTGVTATPDVGQASVSFSDPADNGGAPIDGYQVTVSPGGAVVACAASPCVLTGLTGGHAYTFTVQAHSTYGWSPASSAAGATAGAVPGTPTGVQATFVVGRAPTGPVTATGYPPPAYSVTGGALPSGVSLNGGTGALTGAPSAVGAWSFEITATNVYGTASTTFSGATESIPSVSTPSFGALAWGTPAEVTLVASATPAATWSVTGGSLPAGLVLESSGRLHGTPTTVGAYSATVTASNTHGTSVVTYTGTVAALPPAAPTVIAVQPDDGSLSVAFTPPSSAGGSPVTSYDYSLDHGATWSPVPFGAMTSPITIIGLTNGTEYTVQLRAVNIAGGGAASNEATGTPRTVPSNPTITSVTSGNSSLSVAFTVPTSDGGTPVLGYRYSLDGGSTWSADVIASTVSPVVIYGLTNGVEYQVAILAVSIAGNGVQSHVVFGTPAVAPIGSPVGGGGTALPEYDPGLAGTLVNGDPVAVSSGASGDGWRMATSDSSVSLEAFDADADLVPIVDGSASFEGLTGGYVLVAGQGFKPGSTADVWLFSTPVLLGVPTVLSDGTFSAMLALPSDTPVGQHTIQINGVTADSETISASLGVRVVSARSTLAFTGADVRLFPAALLMGLGVALLAAARGRARRSRG